MRSLIKISCLNHPKIRSGENRPQLHQLKPRAFHICRHTHHPFTRALEEQRTRIVSNRSRNGLDRTLTNQSNEVFLGESRSCLQLSVPAARLSVMSVLLVCSTSPPGDASGGCRLACGAQSRHGHPLQSTSEPLAAQRSRMVAA